jgi:hypothetical protein
MEVFKVLCLERFEKLAIFSGFIIFKNFSKKEKQNLQQIIDESH